MVRRTPRNRPESRVNCQAAAALAGRVAELDGAITGDPALLVELSGLGAFEPPGDTSDPVAITGYALERARAPVGAYGEVLERPRGADEAAAPTSESPPTRRWVRSRRRRASVG
jgi:ferritin-like protein